MGCELAEEMREADWKGDFDAETGGEDACVLGGISLKRECFYFSQIRNNARPIPGGDVHC
jgi:hypothetical protein